MRKVLLLLLIFTSSMVNAQNQKPVAVNDTVIISWDEMNSGNSGDTNVVIINAGQLTQNDSDPDGHTLKIISTQMLSNNSISYSSGNANTIYFINYRTVQPFHGYDTLQYIVSDQQTAALYDTGLVFITVKKPIHEHLNANNIKARVDVYGLFGSVSKSGFEVPVGHGTSSIFEANLWMAGMNNNIPFSSSRKFLWAFGLYNPSNSGPISNTSNTPSMSNEKWEKVWKVTKSQIDWHLTNYTNPGYTVPSEIANWPTHGVITDGEAQFLAPYFDRNGDDFYDPIDGDYPLIKGDQAIYFIYNDDLSMSGSNTMKTETHVMAYAFQCPDSAIQNTIFVDYKIFNRSQNTYDSTSFGMWSDFDLGNPNDDYVQCDVMRNLFFVFNGDDFDDDNQGRSGYGNHPGSQGIVLLKGPKQDNDGIDNNIDVNTNESVNGMGFGDGVTDNEYWGLNGFIYFINGFGNTSDPSSDLDYFNYFSGRWKDGSPMVHGGNGHISNPSNPSIPTRFMFPANSDPLNFGTQGTSAPFWTETIAGNTPQDRRGLGVTGPVTFAPNDTVELTYAFVFGRDYVNTGAQAGVDNMLERVDSIQSYYDQGLLAPCGFPTSVRQTEKSGFPINIYPNPTKDILNITQESNDILNLYVYDITGKILIQNKTSNTNFQLPTSNLTKGLYLLKIQTQGGSKVKTFIKE